MPILPSEEHARRQAALEDGVAKGLSFREIANALGLQSSAFNHWRQSSAVAVAAPAVAAPPDLSPRERHDAAFFKRQSAALRKERDELQHLAEELAGVRGIDVQPPTWESVKGDSGRSIIILHTSDVHMGEVIDPAEIEGINAYNPDICRERMHRLFSAAVEIGPRWTHGDTCDGVLLTMNGDLTSGDIHEELARTNALTSTEQVQAVVEVYDAGIRMLLETYSNVHVAATPGNHGRLTARPTAKLSARLSYDILSAAILRDRWKGNSRVTFQIADGADVRVPLYGRTALVTHGDRMGTGGGMGFAGPILPIVRGGNKVKLQAASAGLGCDLILSGHYHTSAAPPGMLSNGSVPGYSEYGNGLRAAVEPPSQWLARFSLKWGLCERLPVRLDDPGRPRAKAVGRTA